MLSGVTVSVIELHIEINVVVISSYSVVSNTSVLLMYATARSWVSHLNALFFV